MPNLNEEAQMFEWAGIGFGEDEVFKLAKSIKRLTQMSGANLVRFWGKIYGLQKDYMIVEG